MQYRILHIPSHTYFTGYSQLSSDTSYPIFEDLNYYYGSKRYNLKEAEETLQMILASTGLRITSQEHMYSDYVDSIGDINCYLILEAGEK